MDQLDILKSKWQSQETTFTQYSSDQIKKLIHTKSSSIVKWILIIAVLEFVFFAALGLIAHQSNDEYNFIEIFGNGFYYGTMVFHYIAIFIFIYLFYKNYINISADQPSRGLMKNILKTRKTMKYYIWYNMAYIFVTGMWATALAIENDPNFEKIRNSAEFDGQEMMFYTVIFGTMLIFILFMCTVIFLVYQLIYGILLRRLKRNYVELKKMEV
jgi:hypothetical protein